MGDSLVSRAKEFCPCFALVSILSGLISLILESCLSQGFLFWAGYPYFCLPVIEGHQICRLDGFLIAYLTIPLTQTWSPVSVTYYAVDNQGI